MRFSARRSPSGRRTGVEEKLMEDLYFLGAEVER
jgi:hypothetical protein